MLGGQRCTVVVTTNPHWAKHFCIWPDVSVFLIPNELQGARARKDRGRQKSGNGIQLNWPEEATAAKIEGLVTNSASMLIAIQSSLLCGERRLNPVKEKQTCYRLLNRKRRTMAWERNSENIKCKILPIVLVFTSSLPVSLWPIALLYSLLG